MIKAVIHDPIFLALKSESATKEDLQTAQDLSFFVLQILTKNSDEQINNYFECEKLIL